ncbi:hypothetical protein D3C86_1908680 [compost metagenome]
MLRLAQMAGVHGIIQHHQLRRWQHGGVLARLRQPPLILASRYTQHRNLQLGRIGKNVNLAQGNPLFDPFGWPFMQQLIPEDMISGQPFVVGDSQGAQKQLRRQIIRHP